ncbi:transcriptional regulator GcvA [uncultured Sneathiella sp.]|uniref:transcriptional regulator GcvA n=1 Tax=uncultured Sneathiella sp. TaxID=879315 RepID=UPI0030EF8AA8
MRTRLPSLMSLRAFEASARHLSFTQAAVELNLTPTAISHQIKNLEQIIGTRLFIRSNNNLTLTKAAEAYQESVRAAIFALSNATDRAAESSDERTLTVQCLGTFAVKRLLPILPEFQREYPDIDLNLKTIQSFEAQFHNDFDVAIWHGTGGWEGVTSMAMDEEEVFPVISPDLLKNNPSLRRPEDLIHYPVIRTSSLILQDEWPFWLAKVGVRGLKFANEISSDYLITSLHATIDGLGIMMGRSSVVGPDMAAGRLVEPFNIRHRSYFRYHLVIPARSEGLKRVESFRDWFVKSFDIKV